jgi:hypothetical protein
MPKWDYVCVNLVRSYGMNYRRNGIKMAEWKDKPIFEVMQMLGDEGFEFAAYDGQNYIFKKPVAPPQPTGTVQTRPAGQPGQPAPRPPQPVQGIQRPPQPGQAPNGQPRPAGPQSTTSTGLRSLRPPSQEDES